MIQDCKYIYILYNSAQALTDIVYVWVLVSWNEQQYSCLHLHTLLRYHSLYTFEIQLFLWTRTGQNVNYMMNYVYIWEQNP